MTMFIHPDMTGAEEAIKRALADAHTLCLDPACTRAECVDYECAQVFAR